MFSALRDNVTVGLVLTYAVAPFTQGIGTHFLLSREKKKECQFSSTAPSPENKVEVSKCMHLSIL